VAFNVEYHIPAMMLKTMQDKKHRISYEVTDRATGRKVRRNKFVNSYNIAEMPNLTEAELAVLAADQRKREFNRED
jgi:non-homologous end joining protein Ku